MFHSDCWIIDFTTSIPIFSSGGPHNFGGPGGPNPTRGALYIRENGASGVQINIKMGLERPFSREGGKLFLYDSDSIPTICRLRL